MRNKEKTKSEDIVLEVFEEKPGKVQKKKQEKVSVDVAVKKEREKIDAKDIESARKEIDEIMNPEAQETSLSKEKLRAYCENISSDYIRWKTEIALSDIPVNLHKDLAMELLEKGGRGPFILADNLEKFQGLDHKEIAQKLISSGNGEYVADNLDKFQGLDHKEVAHTLIEGGFINAESFVANLEKFQGLDHKELAQMLLSDTEKSYLIAKYLEKFQGLDHKEIAQQLFDARKIHSVVTNLEKFQGLDHKELAYAIIEVLEKKTDGVFSALNSFIENLEKFKGLNHKELLYKILEFKEEGVPGCIIVNLEKFQGLDYKDRQEIIDSHINMSRGRYRGFSSTIIENLEKFPDSEHREIILKLTKVGEEEYVIESLDKFQGLDYKDRQEIIDTALNRGRKGRVIIENLEKFPDSEHKEIALKVAEVSDPYAHSIIENLEKFKPEDLQEIVLEVIKRGGGGGDDFFRYQFKRFEKYFDDPKRLALKMIKLGGRGGDCLVRNLEEFKNIDHREIALKLAENRDYAVIHGLEKFKGLSHKDRQEIVFNIIGTERGSDVIIKNLEKFPDSEHKEIANEIIKAGKGKLIAYYLKEFKGLDHKEIAHQLIDAGDAVHLAKNIEKFEGLIEKADKEKV